MNTPEDPIISLTGDIISRGDGSFIIKPRKPVEWLWVREVAKDCRVCSKTVIRWIDKGYVKGRRVGLHRWQVDSVSVQTFLATKLSK